MDSEGSYKTVSGLSEGLYKEKGSKFIAYAVPCDNEEQVKAYIEKWRKDHHQARHVCYAYRLGYDKSRYRANDDGEPGNSAGAPILGQIQSFDLTNVLIGVVRYFGGTKLGVGGLINAYRTAAQDALERANVVERSICRMLEIEFGYPEMNDVMSILKRHNLDMEENRFEIACWIRLLIPVKDFNAVLEDLEKLNNVEINDKGIQ